LSDQFFSSETGHQNYTKGNKIVKEGRNLGLPQFSPLAEDLGKFLSGIHKARWVDEVIGNLWLNPRGFGR
jgi:hypothetical protein